MSVELGDVLERAVRYGNNCEVIARGHYLTSSELSRHNRWFGIDVTMLSIIVGTAIFGSIQSSPDIWIEIGAGILSISAALLSGLQTLLGYSERAQEHKKAGAEYSALRRSFEIFILRFSNLPGEARPSALERLELLAETLTKSAQNAPSVPDANWTKAYLEVHGEPPKPSPMRANGTSG